MADIVQGLFGVSPESMKAQQDAVNQAQQLQLAQLTPQQQQFMLMGQGGRALGQAVGGLFGAQDPAMYKQAQENKLLQDVQASLSPEDLQDPVKLNQAIYEASSKANMPELASHAYSNIQLAKANQIGQAKELAQAGKINAEVASNKQLRDELSKLPKDATDEQRLNIYYNFASPEVSLKALENKNNLAAARDDKITLAEENRTLAREKLKADNETKIDVARQQGATQTAINAMTNSVKMQLAEYDRNTQLAVQTAKAASASLKAGHPKDVAEAASVITGADILNKDTDKYLKQLENKEVTFGLGTNIAGKTSTMLGMPTENALKQTEIRRHLETGVNELINAAKGTQTNRDADRVHDLFLKATSSNDNQSWKNALTAYNNTTKKLIAEKKSYMAERGFPLKVETSGWSIVEKK